MIAPSPVLRRIGTERAFIANSHGNFQRDCATAGDADSETGSVIAGTLAGWSCDGANPPTQFDGSFDLERLPIGRSYNLYAEPLVGLALPGDFSDVIMGLCSSSAAPTCAAPPVNTNFNVRILPATQ